MTQEVALIVQNDIYFPDSDAAFIFSEIAGTPYISAKTLTKIERLRGYRTVIRPFVRGAGHGCVVNNVVKLLPRSKTI